MQKKKTRTKNEREKSKNQSTPSSHQLPVDRVGQALPRELGDGECGLIVDAGEQETVLEDLDDLVFYVWNWFRFFFEVRGNREKKKARSRAL